MENSALTAKFGKSGLISIFSGKYHLNHRKFQYNKELSKTSSKNINISFEFTLTNIGRVDNTFFLQSPNQNISVSISTVFTTEVFLGIAIVSWPYCNLNPRSLNSIQTFQIDR